MMLLSFLVLVGKVLNTDQTKPTKPGNDPDLLPFLIGKVLTGGRVGGGSTVIGTFPFLIGKVLTVPNNIPKKLITDKFPFLIGKVLTIWVLPCCYTTIRMMKFPFLIGKVLTNQKM